MVDIVESRFDKQGRPPHLQPAASQEDMNPDSDIFVVDHERFCKMTTAAIHAVHRHRHILVTGIPNSRPLHFDVNGLQKLADIDSEVYVQRRSWLFSCHTLVQRAPDSDRRVDNNAEGMLVKGKLRDLLEHARGDSPVALNVLDLPLGRAAVPLPPLFDEISTDSHSANLVKHLIPIRDHADVTSWGTASTRNALSWFHCDDLGLSTSVAPKTGGKWWVLARPKKDGEHGRKGKHGRDNMSYVNIFEGWSVKTIDASLWELEAVHLTPDCMLCVYITFRVCIAQPLSECDVVYRYMRGLTMHGVLGVKNSIVFGRHYWATCSLLRSMAGVVHTFVMGVGITNTYHEDGVFSMLRQMMALWYRHLILRDGFVG